jgi:hypothetical protein
VELIINPERRISLITGDINEELQDERQHVLPLGVGSDWHFPIGATSPRLGPWGSAAAAEARSGRGGGGEALGGGDGDGGGVAGL